jgi:hypothetical protein
MFGSPQQACECVTGQQYLNVLGQLLDLGILLAHDVLEEGLLRLPLCMFESMRMSSDGSAEIGLVVPYTLPESHDHFRASSCTGQEGHTETNSREGRRTLIVPVLDVLGQVEGQGVHVAALDALSLVLDLNNDNGEA